MSARLARAGRALAPAGAALVLLYAVPMFTASSPTSSGPRLLLPDWTWLLGFLGLLLLGGALLRRAVVARGIVRWSSALALVPLLAVGLLAVVFVEVTHRRVALSRASLPDGGTALLTLEPGITDTSYALWRATGPLLRPLSPPYEYLSYSEDGSLTADPALALSRDGARLLVRRGGVWTDCVEVATGAVNRPDCARDPER